MVRLFTMQARRVATAAEVEVRANVRAALRASAGSWLDAARELANMAGAPKPPTFDELLAIVALGGRLRLSCGKERHAGPFGEYCVLDRLHEGEHDFKPWPIP